MNAEVRLPIGWTWSTLGKIAKVGTGTTPSRTNSDFWNKGNVPWITSSAVNLPFVSMAEQYVTERAIAETTLKVYPKNTLILALYGEGKTRGKVSELLIDATVNQALAAIRLNLEDGYHRSFIKYFLQLNYNKLRRQAAGGMQQNLNLSIVNRIEIPVAPLHEQRRIVDKIEELISELDAGVAALKRAKANLKRYRASVLKAAVEGKLTEEWRAKNPAKETASQLLDRILKERRQKWETDQLAKFAAANKQPPKNWQDKYVAPSPPDTTNLPRLSEGWCWASVGQIAEYTRYGSSAKTTQIDSGIPVLRMGNIINGRIDFTELKYLPHDHTEFPDLLLKEGDLLFNRTNSAELVGKTAIYAGEREACSFASYLISVRCLEGCNPVFLSTFINSSHGRNWVKSVVSQQVGQANVNGTKLQALAFPLPPVPEQQKIVHELNEKMSQIQAAQTAIERHLLRTERLRQSILKQAFEGKLVSQAAQQKEAVSVKLEEMHKKTRHKREKNKKLESNHDLRVKVALGL